MTERVTDIIGDLAQRRAERALERPDDTFAVTFAGGDVREARLYTLLWQGFVAGGDTQQQKGMEVLRREVRILDKLEAIGTMTENGPPLLAAAGGTVHLRFDEVALVRRYVQAVPWRTALARDALVLFARLGIPEEAP